MSIDYALVNDGDRWEYVRICPMCRGKSFACEMCELIKKDAVPKPVWVLIEDHGYDSMAVRGVTLDKQVAAQWASQDKWGSTRAEQFDLRDKAWFHA